MRKLFYAFLFAAVALMSGCTPDDTTPEINLDGQYMGVEMNNCEVYYRGNFYGDGQENYIVFFENKSSEGEVLRRVAFEITPSEVSAEKVPVGTFSVESGNMKAGDISTGLLSGSYYFRRTESPFSMLIKEATLTITETDGVYKMEANIEGDYDLDAEPELDENGDEKEPSKLVDIECRFEGKPVMSGLDVNGKFVNVTPYAYFVYYDEVQGFAEWTFVAYDYNYYYALVTGQLASTPAYASQFVIYTELPEEDEEKILPLGKFVIDGFNTGYTDTVLGATIGIIDNGGNELEDVAYDGSVTISTGGQVDGQTTYTISTTMYCFDDAYVVTHEGPIYFTDYTEVEMNIDGTYPEAGFNGMYLDWQENVDGDHWIMTALSGFTDQAQGNELLMELHIYGENGADVTLGLPSGTYTIGDSKEPGTIAAGAISEDGSSVSGSILMNANGEVVALLTEGEMTVSSPGEGVYSVVFEFEDQAGILYYGTGRCESVAVAYPSKYTLSAARATFVGDGGWFLDVADMTKANGSGLVLRNLIIGDEDITFADGIPCEKFRFDTSGNPGTVMAGATDGNGFYYSMILTPDGSALYGLLVGGEVEVTQEGGNYTVNVNVFDDMGNYHRGTYTGAIQTIDGTAEEEAAPAKVQSVVKWSNYNNRTFVGRKESAFGPFKTYNFNVVR